MKYDADELKMVAPCGINCGGCPVHACKDNPSMKEALTARALNKDLVPCNGCRLNKGMCAFHPGECATYECVKAKGVTFCFECDEYPCSKLYPCVDRAEILPHNMKMVNLAHIEKHGIASFLKQFPDITARYFKGKMSIGKGPQI
jgi:hypothetical protein